MSDDGNQMDNPSMKSLHQTCVYIDTEVLVKLIKIINSEILGEKALEPTNQPRKCSLSIKDGMETVCLTSTRWTIIVTKRRKTKLKILFTFEGGFKRQINFLTRMKTRLFFKLLPLPVAKGTFNDKQYLCSFFDISETIQANY